MNRFVRKSKLPFWIFTGLLSAFGLMGSVLDLSHSADAVALITHLGYPLYFITLIGVLRLLGVIAILVPGYPKIKEWAYAGLFFDMAGALYSGIASGDKPGALFPPFLGLVLVAGSYFFYRKGAEVGQL